MARKKRAARNLVDECLEEDGARPENVEEKLEKQYRNAFDWHVCHGYVAYFRDSQIYPNGNTKPAKEVWAELVQTLQIIGSNTWRYAEGVAKKGQPRLSELDGKPVRYDPPIDRMVLFAAARDARLTFPRGRIFVNRSIARALEGIRQNLQDGGNGTVAISPLEVERLRFVRAWIGKRPPFQPVTALTVRAMINAIDRELIGEVREDAKSLASLKTLHLEWKEAYDVLIQRLGYGWVQ